MWWDHVCMVFSSLYVRFLLQSHKTNTCCLYSYTKARALQHPLLLCSLFLLLCFLPSSFPLFSLPGSPIVYIYGAVNKIYAQHIVLQCPFLRKNYLMKRKCGSTEGEMTCKPRDWTVYSCEAWAGMWSHIINHSHSRGMTTSSSVSWVHHSRFN